MTAERPQRLCDLGTVIADAEPASAGALWRLVEPHRQLDANLVRLPGRHHVDTHAEPDLDVLLLVVDGTGALTSGNELMPLTVGELVWLPRGSSRSLAAGERGLSYLTVHQRRPGLTLGHRPPATA